MFPPSEISSRCFMVRWWLYHSIDLSSRHAPFMCDKRIFPLWKGRRFSFLCGCSWSEFKKSIWQWYRKKVLEEKFFSYKKIKRSLKRSEWWKSSKIWQDRFHQLKSLLKKSEPSEKSTSQHSTQYQSEWKSSDRNLFRKMKIQYLYSLYKQLKNNLPQ